MNKKEIIRITNDLAMSSTRFSNILGWHKNGNALNVDQLEIIGLQQHALIRELLDAIEDGGIGTDWSEHECMRHDDARESERTKFWQKHAITMAEEEEKAAKLENERRKQEIERNKYTN
jgi:hypothetical protein